MTPALPTDISSVIRRKWTLPSPCQLISPGPQINIWKGCGIQPVVKRAIMCIQSCFSHPVPQRGSFPPLCLPGQNSAQCFLPCHSAGRRPQRALRTLVFPPHPETGTGGPLRHHNPTASIGQPPAHAPGASSPFQSRRANAGHNHKVAPEHRLRHLNPDASGPRFSSALRVAHCRRPNPRSAPSPYPVPSSPGSRVVGSGPGRRWGRRCCHRDDLVEEA